MKKCLFLSLLIFVTIGMTSTDSTYSIVTIGGYCTGQISKAEIQKNPSVQLHTNQPKMVIQSLEMHSYNGEDHVSFRNNNSALTEPMLKRIETLKDGHQLFFDVQVAYNDSNFYTHPIQLEIQSKPKNSCKCSIDAQANIQGITKGEIKKQKLLEIGKINIETAQNYQLISYKVSSVIQGEKWIVTAKNKEFSGDIKNKIQQTSFSQKVYFYEIKVVIDGKFYYLNPIEIQLGY